jgi:hypothetical protein
MAAKSAMGSNPVPMGSDAYLGGLAMETAAPRTVSTVTFAPDPSPDNDQEVVDTVEVVGATLGLTPGEKCALLYVLEIDARRWPTEGIPEGDTTLLKNEFNETRADRSAHPKYAIGLDWANGFITGEIKTGLVTFLSDNGGPPGHVTPIDSTPLGVAVWRNEFLETYNPTRLAFRARESEPKSGSGFVIGGIFLVLLALAALAYLTLR